MMSRSLVAAALSMLAFACRQATGAPVRPKEIKLSVEPVCPRSPLGQEILVAVTIKNVSHRKLEVPSIIPLSDAIEVTVIDTSSGKTVGRYTVGILLGKWGYRAKINWPPIKLAIGECAVSYFAVELSGARGDSRVQISVRYRLTKHAVMAATARAFLCRVDKNFLEQVRAALSTAVLERSELVNAGEALCQGLLSAEESVRVKTALLRALLRQDGETASRVAAYYYLLKDENFLVGKTLAAILRNESSEAVRDFVTLLSDRGHVALRRAWASSHKH